jgi:hypothetical protein
MTGYLHRNYAQSLAEFGTPRQLPRCGGWILECQIPGSTCHDAMGCYPLFTCQDWSKLYADLEDIRKSLVSLSIVTDPFGEYDTAYLRRCFKDVVSPFKKHFIVDLCRPINNIVNKHHRYYVRKALKNVYVETSDNPMLVIKEWFNLYSTLIDRHNLKGIKRFSMTAFERQLNTPGLVMFQALFKDTIVGAHLWYIQRDIAYSHLSAFSPAGYDLSASYALYWSAIKYFMDKVRWLDLGAGAGINTRSNDGLTQFKRGWSTGSLTAYFCGRIFDSAKYSEILKIKRIAATDYFPAYREGEF